MSTALLTKQRKMFLAEKRILLDRGECTVPHARKKEMKQPFRKKTRHDFDGYPTLPTKENFRIQLDHLSTMQKTFGTPRGEHRERVPENVV